MPNVLVNLLVVCYLCLYLGKGIAKARVLERTSLTNWRIVNGCVKRNENRRSHVNPSIQSLIVVVKLIAWTDLTRAIERHATEATGKSVSISITQAVLASRFGQSFSINMNVT